MSRSRGNGRAVRIVEGPVIPVLADVVADDEANADSRVDLVMRVFWRFPFLLGVEGSWESSLLSSARAWESSFRRRL